MHFSHPEGLEISQIVGFLMYLSIFFYAPVSTFARLIEDMQDAIVGDERVFEIFDTPSAVQKIPGAVDCGALIGNVIFDDINVSIQCKWSYCCLTYSL